MNVDFSKIVKQNLPDIEQPRRGQIYVGFQCHKGCGFCYYKRRCSEKMFSLDFIKRQVDFLFKYGIKDIEITGGEPSEFLELSEVCKYIKSKNPDSKIAVITNGGLFAKDCWDYIDEVLLSYHLGSKDVNYNKQMFPNGCTLTQGAFKTQEKAHALGKLLRTNTVVGTFNIDGLDYIIDDLETFRPAIINFLPVNLFDQAIEMGQYIDYNAFRHRLKNIIDRLNKSLPETLVFVRYMPFCAMEGYEKHLVGHLQHIYDWFDWNRELDGTEFLKWLETDMSEKDALSRLGRYGSTSVDNCFLTRDSLYFKTEKCLKCKYMLICDGVEKSSEDLSKYIEPVCGRIIKNPVEFFGTQTRDFYKAWYLT